MTEAHTKRTPGNLAPLEPPEGAMWDCTGAVQLTYDLCGTAVRAHDVVGDV